MSTVVLRPDPQLFPAGTNVKVYPEALRTPSSRLTGKPPGALVEEVAVGNDGTLTVINLTPGTSFVGWAVVGGIDSYVRFACPALAPGVDGEKERAEAEEATKAKAPIKTGDIENLAVTRAKIALGAIGSAQLGESAVQATNIETFAVTKGAINGEAISDDKIAANRALVVTNGGWGAQVERANNTEFEPSATRMTMVALTAERTELSLQQGMEVFVGGVHIASLFESATVAAELGDTLAFSFFCPPGVKWKVVATRSKIKSSYLIL